MRKYLFFCLLSFTLNAGTSTSPNYFIGLTPKVDSITIKTTEKNSIHIKRIQDSHHKLTDDFSKTSRPCPPFCIQPTKIDKDIKNIAELELLDFMQTKISTQKGLVIDARLKSFYELESIPSSIDLPYETIQNGSKKNIKKIFKILGMTINKQKKWDFSKVKELAIYDNGIWCQQATFLIQALIKYNYPKKKIFYYRAGLQGWKLLGLTTYVHKEIIVRK